MPLIADDVVLGVIASRVDPPISRLSTTRIWTWSVTSPGTPLLRWRWLRGREHALNQELAQADTVDGAVLAAAEELRRLWRARRVLTVTFFPAAYGEPHVAATGGGAARWADLPPATQQLLGSLRDGEFLTPHVAQTGAAGIALQHPDGGVLVVWIELGEQRPFTLEDQTLLTVLAGRLGQGGLQRVHRVDQQRETALALQHAILGPSDIPSGFAVRYQAASRPLQVGGDWYDIVSLDDGRIALVVGDCVGHGLPAATVMGGQIRSACRALLFENPSPAVALAALDRFAARLPGASAPRRCARCSPRTPVSWSTPAPDTRRRSWSHQTAPPSRSTTATPSHWESGMIGPPAPPKRASLCLPAPLSRYTPTGWSNVAAPPTGARHFPCRQPHSRRTSVRARRSRGPGDVEPVAT